MLPNTRKFKELLSYYDRLRINWHFVMSVWMEDNYSINPEKKLQAYIEAAKNEIIELIKNVESLRHEVEMEVETNLLNTSIVSENFKGYGIFLIQSFKYQFLSLKDAHWHIGLIAKEAGIYDILKQNKNPNIPKFSNIFQGFDFLEQELFHQLQFDYSHISEKLEGYDFYASIIKNIKFDRTPTHDDNEQKIKQSSQTINELFKNKKEFNPIWWQGTARQLGYLLNELAAKGFIDKNTNFNEAIKTHFIDKDKNPYKDSIKQNKSGISQNKNQKPKGAQTIDEGLKKMTNK